jgi:hypothetical protein
MSTSSTARIVAFALVLGLVGSMAVHAEIISVPPADAADPAVSLPPPTVLRGSPLAMARPFPICPPGYALSPDYGSGCVGPSGGDYAEGSPGYDYWPDYGLGYPFGGFPGFGRGTHRAHRFPAFHNGRGFHGRAAFHGTAKFGAGIGHMGAFGRR